MLGLEVQNLSESLHPMGPLCGNRSRSKNGQHSEVLGYHVYVYVTVEGGRVRKPINLSGRGFFFSTPHQGFVGSG